MRRVSVAVPVPFLDLLTYSVPDGLPLPAVGARVRVPVGSRVLTGCVVEYPSEPNTGELKDVIEILDRDPLLPSGVVSPFGVGRERFWDGIRRGCSSTRAITQFDPSPFPCRVAAALPPFSVDDAPRVEGAAEDEARASRIRHARPQGAPHVIETGAIVKSGGGDGNNEDIRNSCPGY